MIPAVMILQKVCDTKYCTDVSDGFRQWKIMVIIHDFFGVTPSRFLLNIIFIPGLSRQIEELHSQLKEKDLEVIFEPPFRP